MLASDVIGIARRHLMDDGAIRWSDDVLLSYLVDAVREVYRLRPSLRLSSSDTVSSVTVPTTVGSTLTLGDEYRAGLAWLVAGKALMEDSDDARNMERGLAYLEEGLALI